MAAPFSGALPESRRRNRRTSLLGERRMSAPFDCDPTALPPSRPTAQTLLPEGMPVPDLTGHGYTCRVTVSGRQQAGPTSMCGRFANLIDDPGVWEDILEGWPYAADTGYNIAPSRNIPVLAFDHWKKKPVGRGMRWGLVPSWSKEINPQFATFNARIETMEEKPAFRTEWKQSRTCLIPIRGYYEWKGEAGEKQPYFIHLDNGEPLVLAGIWDIWSKADEPLYSCTIITRTAMGPLADIHPRMPVRVNRHHALDWLANGSDWLHIISHQQHPEEFASYPVRKLVNRPVNDGPHLLERDG
ncbi:MAG: SOS response-associated peptidase [Gammaproteobacteria bacterium]|nr:SOS response-associated peptidase [Gammaproteobacteria bacterium]